MIRPTSIYACLRFRTALKKYSRRRRIQEMGLVFAILPALAVVPWYFSFTGPSVLVWCVAILVVLSYGQTEQRLRTMQIRLATMHDMLHRIAGDDPEEENELLMELVAEVGPVDPDPKLWPRPHSLSE